MQSTDWPTHWRVCTRATTCSWSTKPLKSSSHTLGQLQPPACRCALHTSVPAGVELTPDSTVQPRRQWGSAVGGRWIEDKVPETDHTAAEHTAVERQPAVAVAASRDCADVSVSVLSSS